MTSIKRIILALLTIFAIAQVGLSLNSSLSQPQIQSRLELYQTNLVLHVAEFKSGSEDDSNLNSAVSSLVGEDPYSAANKKYQQVRQETVNSRDKFKSQLLQLDRQSNKLTTGALEVEVAARSQGYIAQKKQLQAQIAELEEFINELDLKRGILTAVEGNPQGAISIWDSTIKRINNPQNPYEQTATLLKQLWQESQQQSQPNSESNVTLISSNLDSWFRYQALAKLKQVNNQQADLIFLKQQESQVATNSVFKLAVISGIPVFGGIGGVILLIWLIVQRFVKPEQAIISANSDKTWETPWDWEITWQVLIVGFFFIGQFVLPLLISLFNISPVNSPLRVKALYVLGTYILMTIGGISVLYLSIKSFFPLPNDWFKFKFQSNWILWGLGGYLVAIPSVLLVSSINQQIWQGQGGSNPLLFLALQAQDKVALLIFFTTASIAAPIFEEIMFRGFLLPSLTRYVSVTGAIVISGLIFAIAHLSLSEVLPLTTLGIILGFVYTRSRNLLAPMLLHCLWNSGTLISLFVLGSGV